MTLFFKHDIIINDPLASLNFVGFPLQCGNARSTASKTSIYVLLFDADRHS